MGRPRRKRQQRKSSPKPLPARVPGFQVCAQVWLCGLVCACWPIKNRYQERRLFLGMGAPAPNEMKGILAHEIIK
jgi:hypothetical protein